MQVEQGGRNPFNSETLIKVIIAMAGALVTAFGYQMTASQTTTEARVNELIAIHPSVIKAQSDATEGRTDVKELQDFRVIDRKDIDFNAGRVEELSNRP